MVGHDFTALNDKEFEVFAADLLGAHQTKRFERFKPGKDQGVDGRYFFDGQEVILQCKHWPGSQLKALISELKKTEANNVKKLNPIRYLLAITHPLSRVDKQTISKIFGPKYLKEDDIFGREDLNDLLKKFPDIERLHYKLWIKNSAQLSYLFNKPILDRSDDFLQQIRESSSLYVQTKSFETACKKLDQTGALIITGAPGIGKTSLANQLVLQHIAMDFEFLQIGDDIKEAENAYLPQKKQFFYFDDFLGRNYLQALAGQSGARIVQFIKRIIRDKSKRFVLTSRTQIIEQGKHLNDQWGQNGLDRNELELKIEELSELDKAKILYNHMWHFSDFDQVVELCNAKKRTFESPQFSRPMEIRTKRYRLIINHANFNPRLIRFMLEGLSVPQEQYWNSIEALLENPAAIWQHPFDAGLDDFGRALVLLMVSHGKAISEQELSDAYHRMITSPGFHGSGRSDFSIVLRTLVGSLLSRKALSKSLSLIDVFNPSISDFVKHRFAYEIPKLRLALSSLRSTSSLETVEWFVDEHREVAAELAVHVVLQAYQTNFEGFKNGYVATAVRLAAVANGDWSILNIEAFKNATQFILLSKPSSDLNVIAEVIYFALKQGVCTSAAAASWLVHMLETGLNLSAVSPIRDLMSLLDEAEQFEDRLDDAIVDAVADDFEHSVDLWDIFGNVDEDDYRRNDLKQARYNLESHIADRLRESGVKPDELRIEQVSCKFNLELAAAEYFAQEDETAQESSAGVPRASFDPEIEDLFDISNLLKSLKNRSKRAH
jgi:adenylate kinase family enzyme